MARDTLRGVLDEFEREGLVERQAGHRGQKRNYWIPAEHRAWYERLSQRLDQLDHEPRLHAELQALVSLRRLATFAIREKLLEPGSIDQLHLRDVEVIYYSLPSWIRKQFLEILRVDTTPHDFEESKKGVWKLVSSMRG